MIPLRHDLAVGGVSTDVATDAECAWSIIPGRWDDGEPCVAVRLASGSTIHLTAAEAEQLANVLDDGLADALRLCAARVRELQRAEIAAELAVELTRAIAPNGSFADSANKPSQATVEGHDD